MEAVFIKALNMSLSATWLILAVLLLRLLLKKAPRWTTVVLWGIVGLRLVLPFSLESVFSLIPSAEVVSPSIGYAQHPEINSGVSVIDNAVNPTLGTSLAATPMNSVNPMQIVLYLGGLVWAGGIAILLLYGLVSYLRLRRKVAEAIPVEKTVWLCDQVKTPFILGVFRPRIYLPSGLNEEETAYVLAHERAHLKRKDHLWKPLGFLLLTVYWFHPLVWVAYILLCRDIEAACDEKVIADMEMTEKKAYANALVSCSMQRRLILACPLAFGEVGVKERVKGVLNYRKPAFWIIVTALIACAVIAVCFLTNPKDDEPDLSFLNYKNAISLIGQNGTAPYTNLHPADSDGVQPGVADAKALAQFLSGAEWTQRRAPAPANEPTHGYVEFRIEENYTITVYAYPRLAVVQYGDEIRYYRTGFKDYEAALATFIPAPSTQPDQLPEPTEAALSASLPVELNYNNVGNNFWAADGCFYYLQDGFYNMGAYRSEGGLPERIFQSSDFADSEHGGGNLGAIFPYKGRLYFTARYLDADRTLYCYDPETRLYAPLFPIEGHLDEWLICEDHFVGLAWSQGRSGGFLHEPVFACDLNNGERTELCADAEAIGLVDGKLRIVCFDGEYELFSYDFARGQAQSLGRFPLLYASDQESSCYKEFSFTGDALVMRSYNSLYRRELLVFRPSDGSLTSYTMPFEIHRLVAAGNSAYVVLYDQEGRSTGSVSNSRNGLYRVDLRDGSFRFLRHHETMSIITELYVADEDCVFWVEGHPRLLGSWRTVYQLSPETGKVIRLFFV